MLTLFFCGFVLAQLAKQPIISHMCFDSENPNMLNLSRFKQLNLV